jgi:putative component of membrane protein insertase Oxa1/YidC/SpoIIIJ protein YidD
MPREEIQNQCEQDIVRDYCLNRKLIKPKTNILTFVLLFLSVEIVSFVLTYILCNLFHWFSIFVSFKILYSVVSIVLFLIFLKRICIMLVELYQHYATDEIRRRCTLMPSCSEYVLLALSKYNVFKALYKTHIRLTRKCKGNYQIDYP